MLWVARVGLCGLNQRLVSRFNQLPVVLISRCNMSSTGSTQTKKPISLLGTMAFGGRADATLSHEMVKMFLQHGHNDVDTAFMYTDGQAETVIGEMNLPKTGSVHILHMVVTLLSSRFTEYPF